MHALAMLVLRCSLLSFAAADWTAARPTSEDLATMYAQTQAAPAATHDRDEYVLPQMTGDQDATEDEDAESAAAAEARGIEPAAAAPTECADWCHWDWANECHRENCGGCTMCKVLYNPKPPPPPPPTPPNPAGPPPRIPDMGHRPEYCADQLAVRHDVSQTRTHWCHLLGTQECMSSFVNANVEGHVQSFPCTVSITGLCFAAHECITDPHIRFVVSALEEAYQLTLPPPPAPPPPRLPVPRPPPPPPRHPPNQDPAPPPPQGLPPGGSLHYRAGSICIGWPCGV